MLRSSTSTARAAAIPPSCNVTSPASNASDGCYQGIPFVEATFTKHEDAGKTTFGLLLKSKGNQYFVTCEKGARENKDSISTALRKGQDAGIKVVTYDTDA
jgi:ABC-type sugar transport system substrate-binding protein